ncbi:hypothetical protein HBN65_03770 [Pseudomonas lundensis]|uniref:hypothetical protein n=1 Tax=Pseudomonas lundensis TaxID=86185 RepID=UPI001474E906|nr:hypothetical protein [Pseudomonas lundensis]NNA05930.1 hypothetical protein [Pseudomonas lundensis]
MIDKDLRTAIEWAKKISELYCRDISNSAYTDSTGLAGREIIKALFVAALSFYGKCFTVGKGRPMKLEDKNVPKELLDAHKTAMLWRHNYASHGGNAGIEEAQVLFVRQKNIKPGRQFGYGVMVEIIQPDLMLFEDKDSDVWLALFEGVRANVLKKIQSLKDKIAKEEVESDPHKYFGGELI